MFVKITKQPESSVAWYYDMVGEVFEVENESENTYGDEREYYSLLNNEFNREQFQDKGVSFDVDGTVISVDNCIRVRRNGTGTWGEQLWKRYYTKGEPAGKEKCDVDYSFEEDEIETASTKTFQEKYDEIIRAVQKQKDAQKEEVFGIILNKIVDMGYVFPEIDELCDGIANEVINYFKE